MVKLNKIYTRKGDDGSTGLAAGPRRAKHDLRVAASSTVSLSARRTTVRARCRKAEAGEPPGRTNERSGCKPAFSASMSASIRVTWPATVLNGS